MDSVIHSTSSLLQTVLDSTAKRLVDAWGNHDPEQKDFSEVITETFRNVSRSWKVVTHSQLVAKRERSLAKL